MTPGPAFWLVYFASGAAGLIYEVAWARLLSVQLGHTAWAVGTVLASFMGGLAAGAGLAGRLSERLEPARVLRVYAAVELGIGVWALGLPAAFRAMLPLLASVHGDQPGAAFVVVRLLASLLLVSVPAAAMGATFPLAVRVVGAAGTRAAGVAGALYAVNTIGASGGALLTGFLLIPNLGLRGTTLVAVLLNVTAGAVAWRLSAGPGPPTAPNAPRARAPARQAPRRTTIARDAVDRDPPPAWLAPVLLGTSGFVALVYEVAFTRALALTLGPTSYAFSAMLAAFISGTAIGAATAARARWTPARAAAAMGFLLAATGSAGAIASWFAGTRLPLVAARAVVDRSTDPGAVLGLQALLGFALLLPIGVPFGALLPAGFAASLKGHQGAARISSVLYVVNTVGAVAGALAASFVLIPSVGLQQTIRVASLVAVAAAGLAFLAGPLTLRGRAIGAATVAGALALVPTLPTWNASLLSAGVYKYASEVNGQGLDLETSLQAGRLLYYKEGATATVSVRELAGTRAMAIDGKIDASNGADMLTQKLLAHLPLMLHDRPQRVAILGLGSGVTLGAALVHPIEQADVVEISPQVVEAARLFADVNNEALADARTRLLLEDGRTYLQLTPRQYDVIISEPSNPWMAGVAALFTREFFEAVRARLLPDGLFCQWAHTYDMAPADLRSIAATFASVFPNGTAWLVGDGDVLFVATREGPGPRIDNIVRTWERPRLAADLATVAVFDTFSLLSLYVAGPDELRQYATGATTQSDDRLSLEFSGPVGVYEGRGESNAAAIAALFAPERAPDAVRSARASAGSPEWEHAGRMALAAHAYSQAFDRLADAVRLDPENRSAAAAFVEAAGASRRIDAARRILEDAAAAAPSSATVHGTMARLLAASGRFAEAVRYAEAAVARQPQDPEQVEMLASIFADAGDPGRLAPLVARQQQAHAGREATWYYAAMLAFMNGQPARAVPLAARAVAIDPRHVLARNLLGAAYARIGDRARAREAFEASRAADPREPTTYRNLGMLALESGDPVSATAYFAEALALDPRDPTSREGLAAARAPRAAGRAGAR